MFAGCAGTYIQPAYLHKIGVGDACGKATSNCQPQGMKDYVLLKGNPVSAPSSPSDLLGHRFKDSLLDGVAPCYVAEEGVHYTKTENEIDAELSSEALASLKASLSHDFQAASAGATDAAKASEIKAKFELALRSVKTAKGKVFLTMYNAPLTLGTAPGVGECAKSLAPGDKVIVGMTTVAVPEVEWTSSFTRDIEASMGATLARAETDAALGFSLKSFLEQKLRGKMKNFSTVWAVGYRVTGWSVADYRVGYPTEWSADAHLKTSVSVDLNISPTPPPGRYVLDGQVEFQVTCKTPNWVTGPFFHDFKLVVQGESQSIGQRKEKDDFTRGVEYRELARGSASFVVGNDRVIRLSVLVDAYGDWCDRADKNHPADVFRFQIKKLALRPA